MMNNNTRGPKNSTMQFGLSRNDVISKIRWWRHGWNCVGVLTLSSILCSGTSLSQCISNLALNRRGRVNITRDEDGMAAGGIRPSNALADGPRSIVVVVRHLSRKIGHGLYSGSMGACWISLIPAPSSLPQLVKATIAV